MSSPQSPLDSIVAEIESSYSARNFSATLALVESQILEAWFGIPTERLIQILEDCLIETASTGLASALLGFASATTENQFVRNDVFVDRVRSEMPADLLFSLASMFIHRRYGDAQAASAEVAQAAEHISTLHPTWDNHRGWKLTAMVQMGTTATLSGNFQEALEWFTAAQMHSLVPSLSFLTRDALVKPALIHAAYGSHRSARHLLRRAQEISPSTSWVETCISASESIAEALLTPDKNEAFHSLAELPLHEVGESWPFYVVAMGHTLESLDRRHELWQWLDQFSQIPLPRLDGNGFSGSVIQIAQASLLLARGDLSAAVQLLQSTDQDIPVTQLLIAFSSLFSGDPHKGITAALALRGNVSGLRILEISRYSTIASGHHILGEDEECLSIVRLAVEVARGLDPHEYALFSPPVSGLAADEIPGWSESPSALSGIFNTLGEGALRLTDREREILSLLHHEWSREQLAAELFISVNTLKSHLQGLYRKLNTNNKEGALMKAEHLGLL